MVNPQVTAAPRGPWKLADERMRAALAEALVKAADV
jgi:hypothetical protein